MMTQEFDLGNVLRLWDSLLSHENKLEFLNFICISIIELQREKILFGEFSEIMESLQRFEDLEVIDIITYAN